MAISGQQLRDARLDLGFTQRELADRVGVSTRTIVHWERDGGRIPHWQEYKIIRAIQDRTERVIPPLREIRRRRLAEFHDAELIAELHERAVLRERGATPGRRG